MLVTVNAASQAVWSPFSVPQLSVPAVAVRVGAPGQVGVVKQTSGQLGLVEPGLQRSQLSPSQWQATARSLLFS
jgi:hypothetical protein